MALYITMSWGLTFLLLGVILCSHSVESVCPSGCVCQDHYPGSVSLDCSNKGLENLPDFSLLNKPIYKLDVSRNRIRSIPSDFASSVGFNVTHINFDGNLITEIVSLTFSGLSNLEYLSFKGNQISQIGRDAFMNVEGKRYRDKAGMCVLDLSDNPLELVERNAFSFLKNMNIVLGGGNRPLTIESYAFYGVSSITKLEIKDVPSLALKSGAFTNSEKVSLLEMSNTTLQSLDRFTFQGITDIETIHIHHCIVIDLVPYSFGGIQYQPNQSSVTLLMSDEDQEVGGNIINEAQGGGTVKIESCEIQTLPSDCFRDTNLATLFLTGNTIKHIQGHFLRGLARLNSVYFRGNIIHALSANSLGHVNGIKVMHLDRNDIKAIKGYAFKELQEVGTLNITIKAGTHLVLEPYAFSKALDIHHFHIVGERSATVPPPTMNVSADAFESLVGVHSLDIENIHLPVISAHSFRGMGRINTLRFINCNISAIEAKAFGPGYYGPGAMDNLDLSTGNKLACDCTTAKLAQEFEDVFLNVTFTCSASKGIIETLTYNSRSLKVPKFPEHIFSPDCNPSSAGSLHFLSNFCLFVIVLVICFSWR